MPFFCFDSKETDILSEEGNTTGQSCNATSKEPIQIESPPSVEEQRPSATTPQPSAEEKRFSSPPCATAEASADVEDLPPSPPPHPVVGQNTPECGAWGSVVANRMSAPPPMHEMEESKPRSVPASEG